MTTRCNIHFDSSRPYGPLNDDDWCEHGNKWVQFHSKTSSGYELGMQLSALNWTEPDVKHVITFELTGMEQDHGYNAIAIVINADNPNGTNDMFHEQGAGKLFLHTLSLESQFECAWPDTRFSLVIDAANGKVVTYIEPCDECPGETWSHPLAPGKRKRTEREEDYKPGPDALPFSVRPTTPAAWTDLGGGLKVRSHDAAWLKSTGVPNVGVRMSGAYDNRATIVGPSSRVLEALTSGASDGASLVVYS